MAKRLVVVLSLSLILFATAASAALNYGAVLTGAQEAPSSNNSPGFGFANVILDDAHTSVHVIMIVTGLTSNIVAAHIHGEAPRGTATNVLIPFNPATDIVGGKMDKTFTITKAIGDAIAARPDQFYLNVHTSQFGGGEVRGQLTPLDSVQTFVAELRGTNEVPANQSTAVGSAFVTLDVNNNVTWEVNAGNITGATRGHIHEQVAGVNGSIVIPFAEGASNFINGNRLKGSATIDAALASRLRANPAGFYVNVHSSAFGGGEIRGQLAAANEFDIPIAGKLTGARGENFVTDVRVFNPSFTSSAAVLLEFIPNNAPGSAAQSLTVNVPARGTAVLNDIGGTTGLNIGSGLGAVRVSSVQPLAVSSVVYDDRRARNGGTIGQFVPAIARAASLRRGVLAQLANNAQSRTNIGIFNPNATQVDIRMELRDPAGTVLGLANLTVNAVSLQQNSIASYFPNVDLSDRAALSLSYMSSAPIDVYASNVDNVSADQIFLTSVEDVGQPVP